MSTADDTSAILRGSRAKNESQQQLAQESRELLVSVIRREMADEMRIAVAEGIRAAMTPKAARDFWSVGLDVLQQEARTAAGGWVLTGVSGLFKKAGLFMLLGGLVYWFGGWAALAKMAALLFGDNK